MRRGDRQRAAGADLLQNGDGERRALGRIRPRAELEAIYRDEAGLGDADDVIAYCRIGERSSHTWFVLHHLLGFDDVKNYDGSWTEWGNAVRVPIATGEEPGTPPR